MKKIHLTYLHCPECTQNAEGKLEFASITRQTDDRIEQGVLRCPCCSAEYPIIDYIPRFVLQDNYADSFGLQWNIHYKTQYDSTVGLPVSETRFFESTLWPRDLSGQLLLEAGCGSGRFTEQVLKTGAMLISFDYSSAVAANYRNNGAHERLLVLQADIRRPPFAPGLFDKIFCFGVLQHTPDPYASFCALLPVLKPKGQIAIDVYKRNILGKLFSFTPAPPSKYLLRPLCKRLPPRTLYRAIEIYIRLMWPLCRLIRKIPKVGRNINWMLLVADHSNLGIDDATAREWACLNTFDMLAPKFDKPQRLQTVRRWFAEQGLQKVQVEYGYNGIVGRAQK